MSMFLVLFIINIHNSAIGETLIFNVGIPEVMLDECERATAKITICNPRTRQYPCSVACKYTHRQDPF